MGRFFYPRLVARDVVTPQALQGIFELESHDAALALLLFLSEVKSKMANAWAQFQLRQNQPLPPGWKAKYDGNTGK